MTQLLIGRSGTPTRRNFYYALLFLVTLALSTVALLVPLSNRAGLVVPTVGDVATQEILSPHSISYDSDLLTEEQRQLAAAAIAPVYAPPNTSVARAQVSKLRAALNFINSVRADNFASPEQKAADLAALQNVHLSPASSQQILGLSDSNWQAVQQETIVILEQIMRSTIREDRLEEARRGVPALISFSLSEGQANLVAEIVSAFVAPNSLYSEALTEAQRTAAREAVEPVSRTFQTNETVVRRGQVITALELEALEELGLFEPQATWREQVSAITMIALCFGFIYLYLRHRSDLLEDSRNMLTMAVLFNLFLFGARFIITNRTVIPYMFPLAAFSMLISTLISPPTARVLAIPLSILAAYNLPNSPELTLYYIFTSMFGVLVLKRAERISSFFWAGSAIAGAGSLVILSFRLIDQSTDIVGLASLLGASLIYALGTISLAVLLQFFLAQALGLTTTLQLIEISRPDHELLQFILRSAPGTYQHSLQIANLAEQAAELINADAMLTRVGALYHDAGKASQPHMFIENMAPGAANPHSDLNPYQSSETIIRHVTDGIELANKHRLPRRIKDFILEHHGTTATRYQYMKAIEAAGGDRQKVNKEQFRYPGPRPQSVETALVMLADGCEARARAERPPTEEKLRDMITDMIGLRVSDGQLDDTAITMKDLTTIIDSFVGTLKGVYHPRIAYPNPEEQTRPRESLK